MKASRRLYQLTVAIILFAVSTNTNAQPAKNVVIADFVSTEELYQQTSFPYGSQMSLADLWGWTYNGQEYALVCLLGSFEGNGLSMIRVTDPNKVTIIKTIRRGSGLVSENFANDVRTFNNHAYVCRDNNQNYYVNLVTALNNPGNPLAGVEDFIAGTRIHNLHINTANGLLFLSDFVSTHPIKIYDINAVTPVFVIDLLAQIAGRSHDLSATTTRIYNAGLNDGLGIIDYTYDVPTRDFDPGTIRMHNYNTRRDVAPNNFEGAVLSVRTHDAIVSSNGFYAFTTDERDGADVSESSSTRQLGSYLRCWDISNPDATADGNGFRYPIRKAYEVKEASATGTFNNSHFTALVSGEISNSIHNVHIRNESGSDIAYISYYTKGLRILNVTNPLSPTETGYYDTPGVGNYIFPVYDGSWGVYPYTNNGAILVSDVRGLYVFRRATEVSGTISSNTTWSGGIFVTNSVTVNSPATLTIQPGTTVAFANGKSLTVNAGARIIADGTSTQTIKFTANTPLATRAQWGNLWIYSTGNVFDNCIFEYGNQVVKILNGGANITNCTFMNNDQAIRTEYSYTFVTNCEISKNRHAFVLIGQSGNNGYAFIDNCHVFDNDRDGIYAAVWADGRILNSHLENNGLGLVTSYHGAYAYNNTELTFYDPNDVPASGLNTIRLNKGAGVYSSNSTVNVGLFSGGFKIGGDNAVFGNGTASGIYNGKQVYNATGPTVNARYTYWGQGNCPPPASFFYGNVDRASCLPTSPTPFSKVLAGGDSITTHSHEDYVIALRNYLLDRGGLPAGVDSLSPYDALNAYFSIIRGDFADTLGERKEVETVLAYVQEKNADNLVGSKAFQYQVGFKLIYGDFAGAEALCEKGMSALEKEGQRDILSTLVSLEIMQGKFSEAEQHFKEFASNYPEEQAGILIMQEMLDSAEQDYELGYKRGFGKPTIPEPGADETSSTQPFQFVVSQNFPNPFNPSTEMRYTIPDRGQVIIRIYNVLGVEVKSLVNETKEAGSYQVFWDGKDNNGLEVASGVYLYRVSFASSESPSRLLTQNGKMSLLR